MARSVLSNLQPAEGSRKRIKRIGRGQGSGHGGTATRGHKGAGARSGAHFHPWFEGGQMPLVRRVPKFGFTPPFRTEFQVVNVSTLDRLAASGKLSDGRVTPEVLFTAGAVSKRNAPVKVLGAGELKSKLEVTAHSFSRSAIQKIEHAGGKAVTISPATAK